MTIVSSSIINLALCGYTALHINLPHNATPFQVILRKLRFVVIGMIAPEVILAIAIQEWRDARGFWHSWCSLHNIRPGDDNDNLGMQGAFFIGMGGFSLGPKELFGSFRSVVTYDGFLYFTRVGQAPKNLVRKSVIMDKSKVESLGKGMVFAQTMWTLIQCILRKANGLPITLLEFHVALHVVITIITYAYWWHKPLDVQEPLHLFHDVDTAIMQAVRFGKRGCRLRKSVLAAVVLGPIVDVNDPRAALQAHVYAVAEKKVEPFSTPFQRVALGGATGGSLRIERVVSLSLTLSAESTIPPGPPDLVVRRSHTLIIGGLIELEASKIQSNLEKEDLALLMKASSICHSGRYAATPGPDRISSYWIVVIRRQPYLYL
jgi:hypothetical protein